MRSTAVALAILVTAPVAATAQTFASGRIFAAAEHPNSAAVADMDGDGHLDVVVPSWSPNLVAIYRGDGAGGFAAPLNFTTGSGPRFGVTVDVNGDGHPDVLTANSTSNDVAVLINNGTGGLVARPRVPAGSVAHHVSVGDFNLDGKPDLAAANSGTTTVTVALGDGTGAFAPAGTLSVGTGPRATAVADFDHDGKLDLAVSNFGSNDVWIFRGDGAGGFGTPDTYAVGTSPFTLGVTDVNGDGWADLAVPNFGSASVTVMRNDGAGHFLLTTVPVGLSPRAAIGDDFDGDGDDDIAVANRDGNTIALLLNDGTGAFTSAGNFGTGSGPFHLAAADFDGDGRLDIVTPNRDGFSITVVRGLPGGTLEAARAFPAGTGPRGVAVGDVDGDGHNDLITADTGSNTVSVSRGTGLGTVLPKVSYAVQTAPYAVVIGDFNADGVPDLASASSSANRVSVLRGNGSGGFLAALSSSAGSGPRALASGDFNADGRLDVATANFNANTVGLLLNTGTGAFAAPVPLATGTGPSGIAAVDVNGDGRLDLATANATTNNVSVLLATGPGTFAAATAFPAGVKPSAIAAGDVNGDGLPDLAVTNETSNNVSILLGDGAGGFAAGGAVPVNTRPFSVILHELTGDDFLDLAVACATTNTVSVAAGHGDGTFDPAITLEAGWFSRAVAAGDFDGDGRDDLAVANQTTNDAWIVLNRSGSLTDLAIAASNGVTSVQAGAAVTYTVAVTNLGPSGADAVTLELGLPAALQGVSYLPSAGAFDEATGAWTGLALGPGDEATLDVSAVVSPSATGTLAFEASVTAPEGSLDPVAGNNSASDVDPVIVGEADLTIAITDGLAAVSAGDATTYTVLAANLGPTNVEGAAVAVPLPATLLGATWTCVAAGGASCSASGSGAIADLADLPAGSQATYTLQGTVDPLAATGILTVNASIQAPADILDPVPGNNSASDATTLNGDAPPVPNPQSVTVVEDGSVGITLTASDPDGDPITLAVATSPAHGVLSGTVPNLVYTPHANYFGPDSFTFSAYDGILSATATVSITVTPVNDPPQAFGQSLSTNEDVSVGVTLGGSDPDGDPLTFTIVAAPTLGTLTGTGAALTYVPQANVSGADSFTFTVSDGQVTTPPATVLITIQAQNDPPTVVSPIADLTINGEDTSATVGLAGRFDDVESGEAGLTLTVTSSNPALVSPSIVGGTLNLALAPGLGGTATVTVRATDPASAFVEDAFVVTVIRPGVRLSVSDANRGEGSAAGVVFTLSLNGPSTGTVTVAYQTVDGTALATTDYGALSGTVTFAPGVTTRTVKVTTVADVIDEDDETFTLVLGPAVGATIEDGVGVGTILDNDTAGLSVQDISVPEGHAGPVPATFTVSLSTPSAYDVTVSYATVPVSGGAATGTDYLPLSGSLTFPAGSTTPHLVTVEVQGDTMDEPNEAFSLQLSSPVHATLTRGLARATIVDDDDPPSVVISDVSLTEGQSGTKAFVFTLTLSGPSALNTRVRYETADGTAVAVSDYSTRSGEVVFSPGATTRTVSVPVIGDTVAEPDETFLVNLHTPANLTIADAQAVGTILNED